MDYFFLCFTGIPSLVPAFAQVGSWIVGLAAFLGDLPFTIITVSSFCSSFIQLFSRRDPNDTSENEAFTVADKPSLLSWIGHGILLVANAAGRSIQVFDGKLISAFAAVACFFSALAGTLSKSDNHQETGRNKANQDNKGLLVKENHPMAAECVHADATNSMQRHPNVNASCEFFSVATSLATSSVAAIDSAALKIR